VIKNHLIVSNAIYQFKFNHAGMVLLFSILRLCMRILMFDSAWLVWEKENAQLLNAPLFAMIIGKLATEG
jgi:hypothetical protein